MRKIKEARCAAVKERRCLKSGNTELIKCSKAAYDSRCGYGVGKSKGLSEILLGARVWPCRYARTFVLGGRCRTS